MLKINSQVKIKESNFQHKEFQDYTKDCFKALARQNNTGVLKRIRTENDETKTYFVKFVGIGECLAFFGDEIEDVGEIDKIKLSRRGHSLTKIFV